MLKFILLGVLIVGIMFSIKLLIPKVKLKYRLYKEEKIRKQRQQAFAKKMEELEIK